MTETILVAHPAPVVLVPKGARKERLAIARLQTPAQLRTLDPDEFEPLGRTGLRGSGVTLRGGLTWAPLRVGTDPDDAPVSVDDFRAFLRGEVDPGSPTGTGLAQGLRQGPLVARGFEPVRHDETQVYFSTGAAVDVERAKHVAYDGRAACAAALSAWMRDEVAVVGNEVRTRVRPLARYVHDGQHSVSLVERPLCVPTATPHLGLDRIMEGVATFKHDYDRTPVWSEGLTALVGALPAGHAPGDDLSYLAHLLVEDIFRIRPQPYSEVRGGAAIEAVKAKLLPTRYAAMTGRIEDADVPDALRLVRGAIQAFVDGGNRYNRSHWFLERAGRHLDASVMPRLDAPAVTDADDIAALAR